MLLKKPGEGLTSELDSLVRVEYLGLAFPERFLQSFDAETGIQCVRQPPREHIPAVPVYNNYQIKESTRHGNIGDVCRPYLVRPCYLHTTEEVGVDFMFRCWLAGPGTPVDGLETHCLH